MGSTTCGLIFPCAVTKGGSASTRNLQTPRRAIRQGECFLAPQKDRRHNRWEHVHEKVPRSVRKQIPRDGRLQTKGSLQQVRVKKQSTRNRMPFINLIQLLLTLMVYLVK